MERCGCHLHYNLQTQCWTTSPILLIRGDYYCWCIQILESPMNSKLGLCGMLIISCRAAPIWVWTDYSISYFICQYWSDILIFCLATCVLVPILWSDAWNPVPQPQRTADNQVYSSHQFARVINIIDSLRDLHTLQAIFGGKVLDSSMKLLHSAPQPFDEFFV